MKGCETKESQGASGAMKSTKKLLMNIAIKGKTRKAFEGYK